MKKSTWKKHFLAVGLALAVSFSTMPTAVFAIDCPQIDENGNHKVITETKEATCTTDGYIREYCPDCKYDHKTELKATGHEWDKGTITKEATYKEEGEKTYTCTVCSETKKEPIPKKECDHKTSGNHEDETQYKAPTCTEKGQQVYVCDTCGGVVDNKEIDPLGHDWKKVEVTKEPTCTEPGEGRRDCSRCNASEKVVISATGHSCGQFTWDEKEHWTLCSVCGKVFGEKKAHTWKEVYRKDATCTEDGEVKYDCSLPDCNASKDEIIPAKGHDFTGEVSMKDENGHVFACKNGCGEYGGYVAHNFTEWTAYNENFVRTRKCQDCGYTESEGCEHKGSRTSKTENEPTCTEKGNKFTVCDDCGATLENEEIAPLGHDYGEIVWGEWVTNAEGTQRTRTGTQTCSRCQDVKTVEETEAINPGDNTGDNTGDNGDNGGTTGGGGYTPRPTTPDAEVPENDVPLVDVPEEDVPLSDSPEVEIPEEETPLADAPETTAVEEERPPLADIPKTGDAGNTLWAMLLTLSAAGALALVKKLRCEK